MSAREEGWRRCRCHCPRKYFKLFSLVQGVHAGKTGFLGGKWVARRKVIRNLLDLMVLNPTGETMSIKWVETSQCSAQNLADTEYSVSVSNYCDILIFDFFDFWWYLEKYINCSNFCQCKLASILILHEKVQGLQVLFSEISQLAVQWGSVVSFWVVAH